jgi:hypothetical protein
MRYTEVADDINNLPNFLSYYENKLSYARKFVDIKGGLEKNLATLPGITEQVFADLQEIEALLSYMEVQLRKIKHTQLKKFFENYNRALSIREAEKYSEGTDEVCDYEGIIVEVGLTRNRYLAVMKGLESKNYMISNISKLRCSGLEDVTI